MAQWALLHRNWFGWITKINNRCSMLPERVNGQRVEVEIISGSCFMVKKSIFEALGGFDSGTFLYYEENILWEKIRVLGLKNYLDCSVRLIHLGAATTSTQATSLFVAKCLIDSTRYYIKEFKKAGLMYRATMEIFYALFLLKMRIKPLIRR